MKKVISVALVLTMLLAFAGCNSELTKNIDNLFSKDNIVKLNDSFTHEDPKDLKYDKRMLLVKKDFELDIEARVNDAAMPDNMMLDENGNPIGMYEYDPETGLAYGWYNMLDGSYTEFPAGEEVDLGKPDESLMIDIPGTVNFSIVLYGNEEKAVASYMYFLLSDASAKETVKTNLEALYEFKVTEISDTVLQVVEDADAIAKNFTLAEESGLTFEKKNAESYAEILKQLYGVRPDSSSNPYKPYADHQDPADLEFDKRVVLTSSGAEAFFPEDRHLIASMTNYIYGKDNIVIADYIYFETNTKEDADELMKVIGNYYKVYERASDTAVKAVLAGQDLEELVNSYIGYNCMKDNSIDEYVRNAEGTYFATIYE